MSPGLSFSFNNVFSGKTGSLAPKSITTGILDISPASTANSVGFQL